MGSEVSLFVWQPRGKLATESLGLLPLNQFQSALVGPLPQFFPGLNFRFSCHTIFRYFCYL